MNQTLYGYFMSSNRSLNSDFRVERLLSKSRAIREFWSRYDDLPASDLELIMYMWRRADNVWPDADIDIPDERWTVGPKGGLSRVEMDPGMTNTYVRTIHTIKQAKLERVWHSLSEDLQQLLKQMELFKEVQNNQGYSIHMARECEARGWCNVIVYQLKGRVAGNHVWSATLTRNGRHLVHGRSPRVSGLMY